MGGESGLEAASQGWRKGRDVWVFSGGSNTPLKSA